MIKIENIGVIGWEHAVRSIPAKSYRLMRNGRYEAFCFDHYRDVAYELGRNPETVRKYMLQYRKEEM